MFSAVRHPPSAVRFVVLQSPPEDAFLAEGVRCASQHCLLVALNVNGFAIWSILMLIAQVACLNVTFDVELSNRKLKSQIRVIVGLVRLW